MWGWTGKGQVGFFTHPKDNVTDSACGQRTASLRNEHIGQAGILHLQSSQRSQFGAMQGVNRRHAILEAAHMEKCPLQINQVPAQATDLGNPQGMAIHHENQCRIAMTIPTHLTGSADELVDFRGRQVLTGTAIHIFRFRGR